MILYVMVFVGSYAAWAENEPPFIVMKVSPLAGNAPLTVELDATESYDPDGNITDYSWFSNDEQEVIGKVGTMSFNKEGVYSIDLKVQDNNGVTTQRTALIFVDRESCPGATAFNSKRGTLYLPTIHIVADPVIGSFIEPTKILSTVNADLKLNQNTGLFEITRFGQDDGSLVGISGGNPATYALSNKVLTISSVDLPVRSTVDNKIITLGTNTFTCSAQLQEDSGSLAVTGCMQTSYHCVTTVDISYDSSPSLASTLDFGRLPVDESFDKEIRVFNTGKFDLQIKSIAITGSGANHFVVSTPELTIPGNAKDTLIVSCKPQEKGKFNATLELTTNSKQQPNAQYKLVCEGEIADVIFYSIPMPEETDLKPIDFGTVVVNNVSTTNKVTVINRSEGVLQVQHAQITGDKANYFSVTPSEATLDKGEKQEFELTCLPLAEGQHNAVLEMVTNDKSQAEISYYLSCESSVDKPIFASVPSVPNAGEFIDFGEITVNETITSNLQILNEGKGELQISLAQITGKDAGQFTVMPETGFSLAGLSTDTQTLAISCTPTSATSYTATLQLRTNDPDQKSVNYPLSCVGTDQDDVDDDDDNPPDDDDLPDDQPVVDSVPTLASLINFGQIELGNTSATSKITVLNRGSAELQVDNITIDGQDADQFSLLSDASFSLSGDNEQTLSLTCTPTKNGTLTATLEFNTNDENHKVVSYPLSCIGSETPLPNFDSIPSKTETIDFGEVKLGNTSEASKITVLNRGSAELQVDNITISGQNADQFSLLSDASFSLSGDNEQTLSLTCTPTKSDTLTATLEFNTNDENHKVVSYPLSCIGSEIIPESSSFDSVPSTDELLDFGVIEIGKTSYSSKITIMNRGDGDLQVTNIEIVGNDADYFNVSSTDSFTIQGNSSGKKELKVTCTPNVEGKVDAELQLSTNDDANQSVSYSLSCEGKKEPPKLPVYIGTPSLKSVTTKVGQTISVGKITIKNSGGSNLNVSVNGIDSDSFSVSPNELSILGNSVEQKELLVSCTPISVGQHSATLTLQTNDLTHETVSYPLSCKGTEIVDGGGCTTDCPTSIFTSSPENTIDFGKVDISVTEPSTQDLVISNDGKAKMTVNYFNIEGLNAKLFKVTSPTNFLSTPLEIAASGTQTVTFECAPKAKGDFAATLKLKTNDPKLSTVSYQLNCSGFEVCEGDECGGGGDPIFTSSPDSASVIDFGDVGFNSVAIPGSQDIKIKNLGKGNLKVDFFNIEGANANIFKVTSPTSLAIKSSEMDTMTLQCAPKNSGDFSATLKLSTNDPKLLAPGYQLKCTGSDCLVDMDPDRRPEGGVGDLGFGYDSDRDLFKLVCLEGTNGTATGTPTASLDLSKSYTFSEVLNEMGFEANAKVKAKVFQLDTSAKFAMQKKDTSLSQTMFFTADYKMSSGVFHPTSLTKIAESIKHNSCQFRNACGDEYVNQTVRGAKLYVAVSFDFNEQSHKKTFEATFGAKYKIVEVAAKLSTLNQEVKKAGRISISAVQVGGKVEELAKILGGSATQNAPVISCSLDNLAACEKMLNAIYQYAQNQFATGATAQPATLGYYTLPYTSVGVPSDQTKVTAAILQARKYLAETYKDQYADLQVVRGWITSYGGKMSEKQLVDIKFLETLLNNNTEVLQLAGMWCLSNLDVCVAKKEEAQAFVDKNVYKLPELMLDDPWESETRGIVWQVSSYKGEPVDGKTLAGTTTNQPRKIMIDGSIKFPAGTVINTNDSLFIEATGDIIVEQGASISVKSFNDTTKKRNVLALKAGKTVDLKGSLNAAGVSGVNGANGGNGSGGSGAGKCETGKPGSNGNHAPSSGTSGTSGGLIYIKAKTVQINLNVINVSGAKGGNGGNGGNGGRGGDAGSTNLGCKDGSRGGYGGNGGNGSNGGNGGDGGTVVLRYCSANVTGQPIFAAGASGLGGIAGSGGSGGSGNGWNGGKPNGDNGRPGATGSSGQSGKIGENVPLPLSPEVCPTPSNVAIIGIL